MSKIKVEFRDDIPVAPQGRRFDYGPFIAALKANPGRWGKMEYPGKSPATAVVQNIKTGRYSRTFPSDQFEAKTYMSAVWVRYIGS